MAGNVKNYNKDKGFEIIPRELLQDENLSLQAIGLLCNLQSYPENWEIHKTEVYKRFSKNKKTSVMSAWEELVEERYIAQLRRRNGRKWDYIYYFNLDRFTDEQIEEIEEKEKAKCTSFKMQKEKSNVLDFRFSASENEKPKLGSSKPESNIDTHKDITHKDITHKNNTENHHHEEFTKKQSDFINRFAKENNLNNDDDDFIKLIGKLKEYKPNSIDYIAKVYKTIKNEEKAPRVAKKSNESNEVIPDWFKDKKHKQATPKKDQKKSTDPTDQQKNVSQRLAEYIANNN